MSKRNILAICMLLMASTIWAQVYNNGDDETSEEDEITVIDNEGREEVIEFPEAMTYDLDSLLHLYMAKTYLDEADDCNMKNVNPVYTKEDYVDRLYRMPTIMEMNYNDVVQKFIDRYSGRLRHSISYMLGASNFYMPLFEEALEAYQLPLELKYLPKETRGYVPAFIAANYIMTYYSQHNICPMTTRLPAQTDTIMVNRNIHLEQVAEVMGMNIDLLRSLNPMYRRDVVPGATELSPIRLPQSEVGRFIDLQDSICNHRAGDFAKRVEVEVKDDVPTYYHKSKRYTRGKKRATVRRKATTKRRRAATRKRRRR